MDGGDEPGRRRAGGPLRGEDCVVQLGLIGLGKMGGNMAERLRRAGHEVVGYDRAPGKRDVESLPALKEALSAPRVVWVMVPAGEPTRATVKELAEMLEPGDVIVDGGNSKYTDDQVHDVMCREKGIGYVDAGFVHAGPVGAGHFSKMVHNGIEYAMMQAYGEGYELLAAVDLIEDVPGVVKSWTQGTVIRSWLLDLLVRALEKISGYAEDSGEGRWTVEQAIENAVPMPAIAAALFARFSSRQEDSPTMKAVAALRQQFGGHAVHAVREQEAERPA